MLKKGVHFIKLNTILLVLVTNAKVALRQIWSIAHFYRMKQARLLEVLSSMKFHPYRYDKISMYVLIYVVFLAESFVLLGEYNSPVDSCFQRSISSIKYRLYENNLFSLNRFKGFVA